MLSRLNETPDRYMQARAHSNESGITIAVRSAARTESRRSTIRRRGEIASHRRPIALVPARIPVEGCIGSCPRIVESKVRPNLTPADADKFVAIDIETGEYELDKNEMKAADRLGKRVPDSQIWLVHVTLGYLHRFGGHGLRGGARRGRRQ